MRKLNIRSCLFLTDALQLVCEVRPANDLEPACAHLSGVASPPLPLIQVTRSLAADLYDLHFWDAYLILYLFIFFIILHYQEINQCTLTYPLQTNQV